MFVSRCAHLLATLVLFGSLFGATRAGAQPLDLIHGTRADVAVSSAYRNRLTQVAALVDGDLETAWNSRTGDLVGAWIEVSLPEDATVTGIALTAGFTKRNGSTDLFTGNHRVTRVRVLRDGVEVGVFSVDPEVRELQTLPVRGPGGVYRLEIAALQPGSHGSWREVCISELQIHGNAPGERSGQRFPRLAMGSLPGPRPGPEAANRDQVRRGLRSMTLRFGREWAALNESQGERRRVCGLSEDESAQIVSLRQRRLRFFAQLVELVELVDELAADRLRATSYVSGPHRSGEWEFIAHGDHDAIVAGLGAVVEWLADDRARCRWANADARIRLRRAVDQVRAVEHSCAHVDMNFPEGAPADVRRECRTVERAMPTFDSFLEHTGSLAGLAPRLRRYEPPPALPRLVAEWSALQVVLSTAASACGWR